jgi:hypothetical protein
LLDEVVKELENLKEPTVFDSSTLNTGRMCRNHGINRSIGAIEAMK